MSSLPSVSFSLLFKALNAADLGASIRSAYQAVADIDPNIKALAAGTFLSATASYGIRRSGIVGRVKSLILRREHTGTTRYRLAAGSTLCLLAGVSLAALGLHGLLTSDAQLAPTNNGDSDCCEKKRQAREVRERRAAERRKQEAQDRVEKCERQNSRLCTIAPDRSDATFYFPPKGLSVQVSNDHTRQARVEYLLGKAVLGEATGDSTFADRCLGTATTFRQERHKEAGQPRNVDVAVAIHHGCLDELRKLTPAFHGLLPSDSSSRDGVSLPSDFVERLPIVKGPFPDDDLKITQATIQHGSLRKVSVVRNGAIIAFSPVDLLACDCPETQE